VTGTTPQVCAQCGAKYESAGDSCQQRFSQLLALDHSRQEPWGSRHGSAFAVYTLQHPAGQARAVLERCWLLLYRIWIAGDDSRSVADLLRRANAGAPLYLTAPPLPPDAAAPRTFPITIADLGGFERETYPGLLEVWCRTTLDTLNAP
jgi:hypothetical protein